MSISLKERRLWLRRHNSNPKHGCHQSTKVSSSTYTFIECFSGFTFFSECVWPGYIIIARKFMESKNEANAPRGTFYRSISNRNL